MVPVSSSPQYCRYWLLVTGCWLLVAGLTLEAGKIGCYLLLFLGARHWSLVSCLGRELLVVPLKRDFRYAPTCCLFTPS
jgi:hypothetical protein